jgi:hypothetical protein
MYAVKRNGFYYKGTNFHGMEIWGSTEEKQFASKAAADACAARLAGVVVLLQKWQWDWALYYRANPPAAGVYFED